MQGSKRGACRQGWTEPGKVHLGEEGSSVLSCLMPGPERARPWGGHLLTAGPADMRENVRVSTGT